MTVGQLVNLTVDRRRQYEDFKGRRADRGRRWGGNGGAERGLLLRRIPLSISPGTLARLMAWPVPRSSLPLPVSRIADYAKISLNTPTTPTSSTFQ